MRILISYLGDWGLGELLCSDPMVLGLVESFGPETEVRLAGNAGNVAHNPLVRGPVHPGLTFDQRVEVRAENAMDPAEFAELRAMPSLIDHMCSYAGVTPSDRRPRLHLGDHERSVPERLGLERLGRPLIALCADYFDPLRHWEPARWHVLATELAAAGATVIEVGIATRLGVGLDLVGSLGVRQTAAVIAACDLFVGNNSGLLQYAQAARTPAVGLFAEAAPARFVHPGAIVDAVQPVGVRSVDVTTLEYEPRAVSGSTTDPTGSSMSEIPVKEVLATVTGALEKRATIA